MLFVRARRQGHRGYQSRPPAVHDRSFRARPAQVSDATDHVRPGLCFEQGCDAAEGVAVWRSSRLQGSLVASERHQSCGGRGTGIG